jgi:hypothetical protein
MGWAARANKKRFAPIDPTTKVKAPPLETAHDRTRRRRVAVAGGSPLMMLLAAAVAGKGRRDK